MRLSPERKAEIDSLAYEQLLHRWRFASAGDAWFTGETGEYFKLRMAELRRQGADHVAASKKIGWER